MGGMILVLASFVAVMVAMFYYAIMLFKLKQSVFSLPTLPKFIALLPMFGIGAALAKCVATLPFAQWMWLACNGILLLFVVLYFLYRPTLRRYPEIYRRLLSPIALVYTGASVIVIMAGLLLPFPGFE